MPNSLLRHIYLLSITQAFVLERAQDGFRKLKGYFGGILYLAQMLARDVRKMVEVRDGQLSHAQPGNTVFHVRPRNPKDGGGIQLRGIGFKISN